jgi:hypothetical protein
VSEPMPPERTEPQRKGLKGTLTRKIGPLPTWVWVLIVVAIILVWVVLKQRKGRQQAEPARVSAGQVPQFVNQTFTNVGPPGPPDEDEDEDEDHRPPRSHPVRQFPEPGPLPRRGNGDHTRKIGPPVRRRRRGRRERPPHEIGPGGWRAA